MNYRQIQVVCAKELLDYSRDRGAIRKLVALLVILILGPIAISFLIVSRSTVGISQEGMIANHTVFLPILICLVVSINMGIDVSAGEVERRSVETTFSASVSPNDIILGKCFAVILISASALFAFFLVNWLGSWFAPVFQKLSGVPFFVMFPVPEHEFRALSYFALIIFASCFFSTGTIVLGFMSKSVREAMSACSLMVIFLFVPTLVSSHVALHLNVLTALVPVLNCELLIKVSEPRLYDWCFCAEVLISSVMWPCAAAFLASRLIVGDRLLKIL